MTDKKMNVESFNLDHTKVKAPYVRLADIKEGRTATVSTSTTCVSASPIKSIWRCPRCTPSST